MGVLCRMEDVLIFGEFQEQHDARLHRVLKKIKQAGVSLYKEKCEFSKERLFF